MTVVLIYHSGGVWKDLQPIDNLVAAISASFFKFKQAHPGLEIAKIEAVAS